MTNAPQNPPDRDPRHTSDLIADDATHHMASAHDDDIAKRHGDTALMSTSPPDPADPTASLTVRYEEDGTVQVEELARAVLGLSPTWATMAFLARERDRATGEFRAPRVSVRRYKRRGGRFVVDKHFTLTTAAQARALAAALTGWFEGDGAGAGDGDGDDDDG